MKYLIIGTDQPEFILKKVREMGLVGGMLVLASCDHHQIVTNLPAGTVLACPCGGKTADGLRAERRDKSFYDEPVPGGGY